MLNVFFGCRLNDMNLLEMNTEYDAQLFHINRGLCNEGLLVGSSAEGDVPLSIIDPHFRLETNKNGWKYEEYVESIVAAHIKVL